MPDITLCTNTKCPLRSNCRRGVENNDNQKSYDFPVSIAYTQYGEQLSRCEAQIKIIMIERPVFDCIFDYWSEEDKSFRKIDLTETQLTYTVPYRSFCFELYQIEALLEAGFVDTNNTEIKDKQGFEYFIYALPINGGCYNQVKNYLDLILSVNPDDRDLAYYLFEHLQKYATNPLQTC